MRNKIGTIAVAILLVFGLSSCWDNPFSQDNKKGDAVDLPVGCKGYVDASGNTRWDQIPGAPTCTLTTTPATTPAPANTTNVPANPTADAPTNTVVQNPEDSGWTAYESEGGIPFNGSSINLDVAPDEVEVITAGPISVNGVMLPGGTTRGSVVIFLSDPNMVVHYEGTSVIAGSNWHASYRPQSDPTSESTWRSLAEFTVNNMLLAPNCSYGTGCTTIDVLVVGPSGIIDQWTLSI